MNPQKQAKAFQSQRVCNPLNGDVTIPGEVEITRRHSSGKLAPLATDLYEGGSDEEIYRYWETEGWPAPNFGGASAAPESVQPLASVAEGDKEGEARNARSKRPARKRAGVSDGSGKRMRSNE